ncbi:hypothetical protein BHE74_00006173 [Ensete ventricosum]|nr:hypothetical protein BHE74_00006173 [Ensete ventricosum]
MVKLEVGLGRPSGSVNVREGSPASPTSEGVVCSSVRSAHGASYKSDCVGTSQGSDLIDEGAFEKLYKGTYNGEDVAIKLLERAQLMEQQFVQEYAKAVLDEEGRIDKSTKIADFGVVLMEVKTEGMTLETRTYRWMAPAYCGPAQLTMASPTQWATEVVGLAPTQ